jgi:hypothetical protein
MIRLFRLFLNPFTEEEVSFNELVACATDSLQRFVAQNPGAIYNTVITGLSTALATVGACASDDTVKLGLRKAAKQAKDTFREHLPGHLGKVYGKVIGHYGPQAPEVQQVFPSGREIFGKCPDDALDDHLTAVVNGLTPLLPAMGTAGTAAQGDAGGLLSTWLALYAASESSTGLKVETEAEKRAAKENLAAKLHVAFAAVLTVAVGEASAAGHALTLEQAQSVVALYFRQDLLEDPASPEEPENPVP